MSGGDYSGVSDGQTGVIPGQKSVFEEMAIDPRQARFRLADNTPWSMRVAVGDCVPSARTCYLGIPHLPVFAAIVSAPTVILFAGTRTTLQ